MSPNSGKWYWEVLLNNVSSSDYPKIGIMDYSDVMLNADCPSSLQGIASHGYFM
jgi:hypothetical protein